MLAMPVFSMMLDCFYLHKHQRKIQNVITIFFIFLFIFVSSLSYQLSRIDIFCVQLIFLHLLWPVSLKASSNISDTI